MNFLNDILSKPGSDLAGITTPAREGLLGWITDILVSAIHFSPEVFGIMAMCFLLIGMVGSKKFMGYAGTCVLLSFVGAILSAAI